MKHFTTAYFPLLNKDNVLKAFLKAHILANRSYVCFHYLFDDKNVGREIKTYKPIKQLQLQQHDSFSLPFTSKIRTVQLGIEVPFNSPHDLGSLEKM